MPEETNLVDFENILILKNQLVTLSIESLKEIYSDVSCYVILIDTIIDMLNNESAFLYLSDSFPSKLQDLLQIHRFDIKDKEIFESINDVTKALNDVSSSSTAYRKTLINNYLEFQKDARSVNFGKLEDLISSLTYDAVVYLNLKGAADAKVDDDLTLASINYILEIAPNFFNDPEIKKRTLDKLDSINKKRKTLDLVTKILSSRAKKKIKEIKTKEE